MENSRIIKFRAWLKNYRIMVRPSWIGIAVNGEYNLKGISLGYSESKKLGIRRSYKSKSFILMQFTGVLDKSGKEIYESDIVRVVSGMEGEVGLVVWRAPEFFINWSIAENLGKFSYSLFDSENLEVIGNVFENKDLLNDYDKKQ